MTYFDLSSTEKYYLIVLAIVTCSIVLISFISSCQYKMPLKHNFFLAFVIILVLINSIVILEINNVWGSIDLLSPLSTYLVSFPFYIHLAILLLGLIAAFVEFSLIYHHSKSHYFELSSKQAIENLNTGLLFANTNGTLLLANRTIYDLCLTLLGKDLQNADEFWGEITNENFLKEHNNIPAAKIPTFILPNGSVWQLSKSIINIQNEQFYQIKAEDITVLHKLSQEIVQANSALQAQQNNLKNTIDNIENITLEEERLASKICIHSDFGSAVLEGKLYLENSNIASSLDDICANWLSVTNKMRNNDLYGKSQITLGSLKNTASALGCNLIVMGELPDDENKKDIIILAVRENLINAIRHGNKQRLDVTFTNSNELFTADIYNANGGGPLEIKEGGGISDLRKKIENIGGKLTITCIDGVRMTIDI